MPAAIKVENLSKRYRLGVINRDMLYKDLQSRWAKIRGKPDPNTPVNMVHSSRIEHGDEFWALRNVNMQVEEGEVFGIVGRNGAGKSTLLKILSQITAPTEGKVRINGRVASLLEVGTGFHPELTGRENVFLNGAILGMSRREIRSKFDEIVAFSEVEDFIDTPVKRYSSGMYVRLAFGVAAHLDPDILIVDEVLAVGDTGFQNKCIGKMQKVSAEGRTVLLVTHSMSLAEGLAARCAWIESGAVRAIGPSIDIIRDYTNDCGGSEGGLLQNWAARRGAGHLRIVACNLKTETRESNFTFERGETLSMHLVIEAFKDCRAPAVVVGFKHGTARENLLRSSKVSVSKNPVLKGQTLECELVVDTSNVPAARYDLYIWLGPQDNSGADLAYDIVDGLLPPIQVKENNPSTNNKTAVEIVAKNFVLRNG